MRKRPTTVNISQKTMASEKPLSRRIVANHLQRNYTNNMRTLRALSFVLVGFVANGFGVSPLVRPIGAPLADSSTALFGIRCDNKFYQLEEMEDKDTCTTELFLRDDGVVDFGDTDGPRWLAAAGTWSVPPGTDDYNMVITRVFSAGQDSSDMGEFTFEVTKTYRGDMTNVGESVGVTGVMSATDVMDSTEREVGYFNMIDATDERLGLDKNVAQAS